MKKSKKRLLLALSSFLGFILLGIVVLPFLVDVDRFRPEVVRLANEKINGTLELGKLKLTLWGKIAVKVERARLLDSNQKNLISVGDFEIVLPLLKLIKAEPEVRIWLVSPVIEVERNARGEWNLAKILKQSSEQESVTKEAEPENKKAKESGAVPSWIKKAGVSLSLKRANLLISDLKTQSQYELKAVNVETGLLSLDRLPAFSLSAQLNTKIGQIGEVAGPFELQAKTEGNSLKINGNFDQLLISFGEKISKQPGVAFRFEAVLSKDKDRLRLQDGAVVWDNAQARLSGFLKTPQGQEPLEANLLVGVSGIKLRGPYFKQDLVLSGDAEMTLDSIEKAEFKLKGTGFDLGLFAQVKSFTDPRIKLEVESNGMDLDQLIDWKAMKEASKSKKAEELPHSESPPSKKNLVGKKEQNSAAQKAEGTVGIKIKALKAYNIVIEPIKGQFGLRNLKLVGRFDEAQMLGGRLAVSAQVDASDSAVQYAFQTQVKNVSLEKAVSSQVEWLKNTFVGSMSGEMSGQGEGLEATQAKRALKASGKILVKPAKLSSIDINQIVVKGISGTVSKVAEKIPSLRGKELKMEAVASDFQQISSSFKIADGKFVSPDFYAQAVPGKGIELRGETQVGLLDYNLEANWEVSDPYNVLKMKEVSVEEAGFKVDSILIERGKAFQIPLRVRGNLFKPEYDYGEVPEALANIALKNISLAAQDRAKEELKKQAQEKVKQLTEKAPEPVKNLLKGIFK